MAPPRKKATPTSAAADGQLAPAKLSPESATPPLPRGRPTPTSTSTDPRTPAQQPRHRHSGTTTTPRCRAARDEPPSTKHTAAAASPARTPRPPTHQPPSWGRRPGVQHRHPSTNRTWEEVAPPNTSAGRTTRTTQRPPPRKSNSSNRHHAGRSTPQEPHQNAGPAEQRRPAGEAGQERPLQIHPQPTRAAGPHHAQPPCRPRDRKSVV